MSATNRGSKRHQYDFYSTPVHCTEAICSQLVFPQRSCILEPCSGEGAIARVVERFTNEQMMEFDIQRGEDFLELDMSTYGRFDMVITNPPFSIAQEFVEKSLLISNCVVMLLRMNFVASAKRKEFWERNPWTGCGVLTKRPSFTGKGTDATDYAWFIWDKTERQRKGMFWL